MARLGDEEFEFRSKVAEISEAKSPSAYIDSGATHHFFIPERHSSTIAEFLKTSRLLRVCPSSLEKVKCGSPFVAECMLMHSTPHTFHPIFSQSDFSALISLWRSQTASGLITLAS